MVRSLVIKFNLFHLTLLPQVVAVDQVVVTTVVELLMVVILAVTHKDLHSH